MEKEIKEIIITGLRETTLEISIKCKQIDSFSIFFVMFSHLIMLCSYLSLYVIDYFSSVTVSTQIFCFLSQIIRARKRKRFKKHSDAPFILHNLTKISRSLY